MSINLNEIGNLLKVKREEKGLNYNDISKVLCLRKSIIEAIETGNKEVLPHEVYLRGYIKEYATLLNIYDEISPYLIEKTQVFETSENAPVEEEKSHDLPIKTWKKTLLYPVTACLLVIAFFIFDSLLQNKSSSPIQKTTAPAKIQSDVAHVEREEAIQTPLTGFKKLMITCHERTWVSVVIDDMEKKEFMLNPHEMIVLNGKEKFDLLIGNAGGVKILLNGKDTEFSGKSGEVKRIKLS